MIRCDEERFLTLMWLNVIENKKLKWTIEKNYVIMTGDFSLKIDSNSLKIIWF
jgi:hypothetical protein